LMTCAISPCCASMAILVLRRWVSVNTLLKEECTDLSFTFFAS
jgi:hypothetical protein